MYTEFEIGLIFVGLFVCFHKSIIYHIFYRHNRVLDIETRIIMPCIVDLMNRILGFTIKEQEKVWELKNWYWIAAKMET